MTDSATELGRIIGGLSNDQSAIKENLSPDDVNAQLNVVNSEQFETKGVLTATKFTYASDSFIIDHPVQGELDSAVYLIDGGYTDTIIGAQFPLDFSDNSGAGWAFNGTEIIGSEVLFTTEF